MTPLCMALKNSAGREVSLRVGKNAGWPDGARMDWVRLIDGKPEIVTATLALHWRPAEEQDGPLFVPKPGTMFCAVDWDHSEPWAGDAPSFSALDDSLATTLVEWADTLCAEVNKALDHALLTAFADLHWHEVEAARAWTLLPADVTRHSSAPFLSDGDNELTFGERELAVHVARIVLDQAERNAQRRAAAQYEAEGGALETEPRAGNEAWKPSVPNGILERAARTESIVARWGPLLERLAPHDVAGHVCAEECRKR